MSLNIKNQRVHDLAREAARRSGETQTSVIEKALEQYLADLDVVQTQKQVRLDEILADIHSRVRATEHLHVTIEDLYDPETGLPA